MPERNANVVCPFCGCFYDHDELVALYDLATDGMTTKSEGLAKLNEFRERVLSQPGNAEPQAV